MRYFILEGGTIIGNVCARKLYYVVTKFDQRIEALASPPEK